MNMARFDQMEEITMRLVHYLVTKEDYRPMVVSGVEDEVWLENTSKKYEIIRINANYIHNNEQLSSDINKTKYICKEVNRKTLSFKAKAMNILLNVGENVDINQGDDKVEVYQVNDIKDLIESDSFMSVFPDFKLEDLGKENTLDFFMNVTHDINKKNEQLFDSYEQIFKNKIPYVTYILIAINIIIFILANMLEVIDINMFCSGYSLVKNGEFYRLITAAFFHGGILHLACNMYALYILGTQTENYFGKVKFLFIYLFSAIVASLFSAVISGSGVLTVGASGAIFGLMGSLLYFGYHYRLYLGKFLTNQLLPLIGLNLILGFSLPNIDNFAHIGGLIGGLFISIALGEPRSDKKSRINGIITSILLIGFLIYILFFR